MSNKYHARSPESSDLTQAARELLGRGYSVIPVSVNTKQPMIKWKEYQTRRPEMNEIERWFDRVDPKSVGIGIVTGAISQLTVVDFDTPEAFQKAKRLNFPSTPLVKTGRGFHAYCRYKPGSRNFQKRDDLPGTDLRSEGGYVITPPSMHQSGCNYSWEPGCGLADIELAEVPDWIWATKPEHKSKPVEFFKGAPEGSRNDSLAKVAGTLFGRGGYTLEEAIEFCRTWNQQNESPLSDTEIVKTVTSIFEAEQRKSQLSQLGDPLPLIRPLQKNDPFPVDALPPVMRAAVMQVRKVVQAPLDMICQSFLAAATLAVQPHADVLIDGRRFPASNNFIAIGESGERKSATDRIATGPIKERQRRESEFFHQGIKDHEARHAAWDKARKAAFKEDDKDLIEAMLSRAGEEPKHVQPFYILEEPSFEGLERAYAEGRYTLGLFSDEGGRFLGGYAMSRDNQTKTVTGLSKLWDGEPVDRVRGGDGLSVLYGRRFSMHLMIQPVLSGQLFGNAMLTGQGFLSRCLCSYPTSTIGTRKYVEHNLTEDRAIQDYNQSINDILDIPLPIHERSEMGLQPRALPLEATAKKLWIEFADHIEGLQTEGGDLNPIKGFASKSAEHAARIAGVLAIFETPDAMEISIGTVNSGIAITQYYIGEALRLFHSASDDQELMLAQKVLEWGAQQPRGIIALAELYRCGPNAVRDKKTASRMIEILEQHNRVQRIVGGTEVNGKPRRDVWQLRDIT